MADETERVTASTTIDAAPEAVFAVLADPSAHADIDGTGWVRGFLDGDRITAPARCSGWRCTTRAIRTRTTSMYRLGHASPQAALRYQHATRERDVAIADAIDALINPATVVASPSDQP